MLQAKLVAIEGIDGSGKATQSELLRGYYARAGQAVRRVSFPDYASASSALVKLYLSGGIGEGQISSVNAYAASSFYATDRYISYLNDWKEDYEGGVVVADRYTTSNIVHQMLKLPEDEWPAFIRWIEDYEYTKLGLPRPDLVLYLDLPLELAIRLVEERYEWNGQKKDIHEKDCDYLAACRRAGDYAADLLGWRRVPCAKAGNIRSVEAIAADIQEYQRICF